MEVAILGFTDDYLVASPDGVRARLLTMELAK